MLLTLGQYIAADYSARPQQLAERVPNSLHLLVLHVARRSIVCWTHFLFCAAGPRR